MRHMLLEPARMQLQHAAPPPLATLAARLHVTTTKRTVRAVMEAASGMMKACAASLQLTRLLSRRSGGRSSFGRL